MDGWISRWMDKWNDKWVAGWVDGWIYRPMNKWNRQMDVWIDGQMDG